MQVFGPGTHDFILETFDSGRDGAAMFDKFVNLNQKFSFVRSFRYLRNDDFAPVKCLGDKAYINVFGKAPVGQLRISMMLAFWDVKKSKRGKPGNPKPSNVYQSPFKTEFEKKRISSDKRKEVKLTIGSLTIFEGYITSFDLNATAGGASSDIITVDMDLVSEKDEYR